MRKVSLRKIKSALSPVRVLSAAIIIAACVVVFVLAVRQDTPRDANLKLATGTYTLETATTQTEQEKGLGGRPHMPERHGMVFIFGSEAEQCFWMKDTLIPLDMVWLNTDKRVSTIEHTVVPATYPRTFCHQGKYVIELNAGVADHNNLTVGQQLSF